LCRRFYVVFVYNDIGFVYNEYQVISVELLTCILCVYDVYIALG